jgi:FtsH-binding integral membrane protein
MALTRKDLAATVVVALVVLVYVANIQDWWYLGGNRWATVTMSVIGTVGCALGARPNEKARRAPIVLLGALGVASVVLTVIALVTADQWALLALTIVLVALWAGATLRHAATPHRPVLAQ